jgi:glycosyltransferase involved in cell wall biosynthesis
MKVGYDEQVLLAQTHGGISRYFVNLLTAFRRLPEVDVEPVPGWRWSPNSHATDAGLSRRLPLLDRRATPTWLSQGGYYMANAPYRRAARRVDVLHHTYYHPYFLGRHFTGTRVTTIHDMNPELFPELFPGRNPHLAKARYVAESDVVICDSESARRDLFDVYGDPGVPTPVVYLGVDQAFAPSLPPVPGMPERFILFVGKRDGYKDFDVLAQAYAALPDDGTALIAVGGGAFNDQELRRLTQLCVGDRVRHMSVTDAVLPRLYASALVFVFPSRHEGFGLGTLEAMACGTATVLADSSSHPEVGGDVARYFPPGDDEALRRVLEELLRDASLRTTLGLLGVQRAAGFTWDTTARATAEAYTPS